MDAKHLFIYNFLVLGYQAQVVYELLYVWYLCQWIQSIYTEHQRCMYLDLFAYAVPSYDLTPSIHFW